MNYSTAAPWTNSSRRDALEARFGLRASARLSEASERLPHDVTERLRVARDLAVSRANAKRLAPAPRPAVELSGAVVHADGTLSHNLFGSPKGSESWWVRLSAVVPLLFLVVGLLVIHAWERQEQIAATADIDTALLSDTLPPEAYTDPGFNEYLRSPPELASP